MNKKFSTLAAVFLAVSALSTSAVANVTNGNYYRLKYSTTTPTSTEKYLGVDIAKTDSVVLNSKATGSTVSAGTDTPDNLLSDRYFWKVNKTIAASGDSLFTFTNRKTGKVLAFDAKEANAIISGGAVNTWGWKGHSSSASGIYSVSGGNTYYLVEESGVVKVKKQTGVTPPTSGMLALEEDVPAAANMSAKQLNEKNGGKGFELAFSPAANGEKNLFIESMLRAEALHDGSTTGTFELDSDADHAPVVSSPAVFAGDTAFFAVSGKVIENAAKQKVQYYLVADTTYFTGLGTTGVVFTQDTLKITKDAAGKITKVEPAPGRVLNAYRFVTSYNYDKASMNIEVVGLQAKKTSGYYKDDVQEKSLASGKSWYVYVAELSDRKEVSVIENATAPSTKITFKTGSAISDLNTKVAYAVQKVKDDGSLSKYYGANNASTNKDSLDVASALVPATQYIMIHEGENNYSLYNRAYGNKLEEASGAYYKTDKEGIYRINGTDYKLTALTTAAGEAGKYVGYRHFSDSEVANTSFTLRVQSIAGNSIFIASKDSSIFAANSDGQFFTVKPYDSEKFGYTSKDSLSRTAYMLVERYGDRHLAYDKANKFVLSKEAYNTQNDTVVVFFQATATEGQYLLAYAQTDETKGKLASTSMDGNYIIANITTGAIEKSASTAVAPTVFVFENEKNEYQAEAAGHKIITLASDDAMSITRTDDNFASLKRVGQLRSAFEAENFALWVDTADATDETKPLYFISTKQGLDSATVKAGNSLYMVSVEDSTANAYKWEGLSRVAFIEGKYVAGTDSLELYTATDTAKYVKKHDNEANWAFALNPDGGVSLQNMKSNQYVATRNDVLVMVKKMDEAAMFGVAKSEVIPTSNGTIDAVEGVSVTTDNGTVTIQGAAGKSVVISNILGKVVAETVLTSDNVTIAVPAGIVAVAVEGETAVKVVVK